MIRKFIFASLLVMASMTVQPLWSQDCTPVAISTPGILPASLPDAQKNQAYNETISVLLFSDTMVNAGGQNVKAVIDSMVLLDVFGLPKGINYRCRNGNKRFLPKVPSCIALYGTPTEDGTYPLEIPVMSYAKVFGFVPIEQGDTIRNYVINVYGGGASLEKINLSQLNVFPNPASDRISVISGEIPRMLASNGVECVVEWRQNGSLQIAEVSNLASGVYLIYVNGRSARFVKP